MTDEETFEPFHSSIPFVLSPNRRRVKAGDKWLATIIHYTASRAGHNGDAQGDIDWLCNPASRASAHFVVARNGNITQLVPLSRQAFHAGISQLGDRDDCNEFTLGIELDNQGRLVKRGNEFWYEVGEGLQRYRGPAPVRAALEWPEGLVFDTWWEPYPEAQLVALERLLGLLAEAGHHEAVDNLFGHDEIATPRGRKQDPGPLFPWERFKRRTPRALVSRLVIDGVP